MTLADKYLVHDIENILKNGYKDENPRPKYEDGEPSHTYSVNHVMRKYDLSKGEFPICTLRRMPWKTAIKEVLAIYQNQSNKGSELERSGILWWTPWYMEDGTIGKAYPYNLESHRPNEMKRLVKKIDCKYVNKKYEKLLSVPTFEDKPSIDGEIYLDRYVNIGLNEEMTNDKHKYYNIRFISNNYVTYMREDLLGKSNGVNPYDRTTYGVGYLDEYKTVPNFTEEEIKILKDKWENMFRRCYSENYLKDHKTYKDKKLFVHQRWHSFKNFLEDVKMLPQYFLAREENFKGWDLDKDYYGSNAYSKDTCVFLKHRENSLYAKVKGCYKITDTETNKIYYEISIPEFAEMIGSNPKVISKCIRRNNKYKNYIFEFLEGNKSYVYRFELSKNQVNSLMEDIQNNPYSRRHIISFWHWANIDKKALVECAYETLWNVRNTGDVKYLDMCLIQRSGDMLVASGAGASNEIQYAALLMMIARHCGYKPGIFTHFVSNEQIYDRHIKQANTLLDRFIEKENDEMKKSYFGEEEPLVPKLILNPSKINFYDFTINDFEMVDYEPMTPNLRFELGI